LLTPAPVGIIGDVTTNDPAQSEASFVSACLALAREVYEGPVRINIGRDDDMWAVEVVRDAQVSPRRGSWPTIEDQLIVERAADRVEALKQLQQELARLRQSSL
jgi:hypothetical protein